MGFMGVVPGELVKLGELVLWAPIFMPEAVLTAEGLQTLLVVHQAEMADPFLEGWYESRQISF